MTQKERHALNAAKRRIEEDPIVEKTAKDFIKQMESTKTSINNILEECEEEAGIKLRRALSGKFAVDTSGNLLTEDDDEEACKKLWELIEERQNALHEDYPLTKLNTQELIDAMMAQNNCPHYRRADVGRKLLELNEGKPAIELNPFECTSIFRKEEKVENTNTDEKPETEDE